MAEAEVVEIRYVLIKGTPKQAARVAEELGLDLDGTKASTSSPPPERGRKPSKPVKAEEPDTEGEDEEEEEPAKPTRRGKKKTAGKKKASRRAKAPPPEEEEEEEEDDEGEGDEDLPEGVDPQADELQGARRLRDVISYLDSVGVTDLDEIIETCEAMQEDVLILKRVKNIADRVTAAHELYLKQKKD